MAQQPDPRREQPPVSCPICRKPATESFAPFCSQRCADVDLGRWLGERYVIPGSDPEGDKERDEGGSL
ncbi:DNA gyrase inhibitor YacG [Methylobacterium gnaphalii]|uniref:DNA gyrase inhibitor YacG n=1 Tax=Methylobacterium gnaphalii TaxID=1010610 RepID=UPI0011BF533B|nr:DNA gyrase inhibitor YacG [Methylobacterium gnaphalii]GJD70116.1 DNA gyrase inhibitor YacG [Methylobacterium gnaphalii]